MNANFALHLDKNTSKDDIHLLGFPKGADWVLNQQLFSNFIDMTGLKDWFSYSMYTIATGTYAPRSQHCVVFLKQHVSKN